MLSRSSQADWLRECETDEHTNVYDVGGTGKSQCGAAETVGTASLG